MCLAGLLIVALATNCVALHVVGQQPNELVPADRESLNLENIITYVHTHPPPPWDSSMQALPKTNSWEPNHVPVASSATSGREFQMTKTRNYTDSSPQWNNVPREPLINTCNLTNCKSAHWAVVTTIFNPSEAVKYMESVPGWCTVVVGDKKSPPMGEYLSGSSTVIYLSSDIQECVFRNTAVFHKLAWNSFGRKNLGYMFAMSQGANTIFDFDDDNVPQKSMPQPIASQGHGNMTLRVIGGCAVANAYPLFTSQGHPWPRGLPLSGINKNGTRCHQFKSSYLKVGRIAVEQILAQSNPDVDAIYRLTQKLPLEFRQQEDPVVLEPGTFVPFNAQATLWHRPAFMAMLLPITVNGRVSDILRSYIAQPILWASGLKVAYNTPQVQASDRNPHNLIADFEGEWPLYYKTDKLVEGLAGLRLMAVNKSLAEQLFDIYVYLYEHEVVEYSDVEVARAWIEDVQAVYHRHGNGSVVASTLDPAESMAGGGADESFSNLSAYDKSGVVGGQLRKEKRSTIVKLILMTKDEWPLIKDWTLYHGEMFGFKNLHIVDGSADNNCTTFLKHVRDTLGVNVVFSSVGLDGMTSLLNQIMHTMKTSSDIMIKMDTDEFVSVRKPDRACSSSRANTSGTCTDCSLSPYNVQQYVDTLAIDGQMMKIGYAAGSLPHRNCTTDIGGMSLGLPGPTNFKSVFDSKTFRFCDLGGHNGRSGHPRRAKRNTDLGIIHLHSRCLEQEVDMCRKVLVSHGYVRETDSPGESIKKLQRLFGSSQSRCQPVNRMRCARASCHKAWMYAEYKACPAETAKRYYASEGQGCTNPDFQDYLERSVRMHSP